MMAKRKRLSAPNPDFLPDPASPEARSMFTDVPVGKVPDKVLRRKAPIADVAQDASATAALDEMSRKWAQARAEGRIVLNLSLTLIDLDYLVRDRIAAEDDDFQALKLSLSQRGQQTPVEVADLGGGRFGLISGWRRCRALKALHEETGDARFETVLALLRRPSEATEAYVAMVEENEIRVDLSFFERARIVAKSVEQGVFSDRKQALKTLFASASRAKRSKVGSFLRLVDALDGVLRYPEAISERAGLRMVQALDADPALAGQVQAALQAQPAADAAAELACVGAILNPQKKQSLNAGIESENAPAPRPEKAQGQVIEPLPGLTARRRSDGSLHLSGPALDDGFYARLMEWLKAQR